MNKTLVCAASLAALAILGGCTSAAYDRSLDMPRAGAPVAAAPQPPAAPMPAHALNMAMARLVTADGRPAGQATLTDTPQGLEIRIAADGLPPGPHGFHIHANGACAPGPDAATGQTVPFGAAGGHFDPGHTRNHGHPGDPANVAHAGELPNLVAGADGKASLQYLNRNVTVAAGSVSVLGRTLVIHEKQDDYQTDPAGDSGGRLLCGLIEPATPNTVLGRATLEGSNVFPEGIAVDPRSGDAFVGSSGEGHLYRIPAGGDKAEMFQRGGSQGRQTAYGLRVDDNGRLWVAGGPAGTVSLVDVASGAMLGMASLPRRGGAPFLNDLAFAGGYAYVTDSAQPVLWRIRMPADAQSPVLEPWLDLSATAVRYVPNQFNLNGIVASADGRWLLAVQTATGQLWRIDTGSRAVREVTLEGGDLKAGDGLVLRGASDLYVLRNAENEVTRVALADGWASGRIVQRLRDPRLRYPTTAALTARGLMVVNAQTDRQKAPPPLLPFDVLTLGLPAR